MRVYETQDGKKLLKKIVCNQCGREISTRYHVPAEDVFCGQVQWGYFSGKDGEIHSFDLCETCYDRMAEGFAVKVDVKYKTEVL